MEESFDLNTEQVISGLVENITYRNTGDFYTVASVRCGKEKVTVVGILPFLGEGESAEFTGKYTIHPTYGQQFKAESYKRKAPETAAAILKYLSTGAIRGIGPSTANKIVEKFGDEALGIIQNHPDMLATIKGISLQKAYEICDEYAKQFGVRDIMFMLSKYGISPEKCLDIYRTLGENSKELIEKNPYILCEEKINISFEDAELIAADYDFEFDNELRIAAGLEFVLKRNLTNGHTCLPRDKFIDAACRLLGCGKETAEEACDRLIECFRLSSKNINGKEFVSLLKYYSAEEYIAARLFAVKRYAKGNVTIDPLEIDIVEKSLGIEFEELQRNAISEAFESGILILTGGPGTGKTTTLNAIIKLFENRELNIQLAAPTGRAAQRITELTGKEAKTIHRLLELEWEPDDRTVFSRNEKNPLECDVLIVDEASMIDSLLFESLLKALRLSCRIILVGDADQLPSIGAGNILNDILSTQLFPSIRLKKVFRQSAESRIVTNAHALIDGKPADFSNTGSDCFFLKRADKYDTVKTVLELCSERLPAAYGFNPVSDIQVLCPSRKTDTGCVNLNNHLQERFNPLKKKMPQLFFKGFYIRPGDKVMQIKNNYDLEFVRDNGETGMGIYNGDIGFVEEIDRRGGIVKVRFDDRVATYYSENIGELELAYAMTVHKSQGSEFDCVVIPLLDIPQKLSYRNLLYTAVTRAKKLLVIVGSESVWNEMAANNKKNLRYTMLKEFLYDNDIT